MIRISNDIGTRQTTSKKLTFIQTKSQVKRNTRYPFIYDNNINLFSLALNINSQQDLLEPVEQNVQYEFEERNNQDIINLRTDDIEKEEYLEIKCELISLMNHARHILDMNDNNPNG